MRNDPCTGLSRNAGGNAINIWLLATQNSLSQTSYPKLPHVVSETSCSRLFQLLWYELTSKCHALIIGLTFCIVPSLATLDTEIYDGGSVSSSLPACEPIRASLFVRVYSSWDHPGGQDNKIPAANLHW
ncbi:hypothetical protein N7450_011692 [Penicillium hetheringtonii]|uniref:Uncharacterized protein n=1 Tax=Penicillium hetheringtonii TaxID=911720 RepID=A0AAD6DAP8_9EURO|nr:hypothetical protein N7450_011692 [Penicillium hetheringtonii]